MIFTSLIVNMLDHTEYFMTTKYGELDGVWRVFENNTIRVAMIKQTPDAEYYLLIYRKVNNVWTLMANRPEPADIYGFIEQLA